MDEDTQYSMIYKCPFYDITANITAKFFSKWFVGVAMSLITLIA